MKARLYTEASEAISGIDKEKANDIYALSFYIENGSWMPSITIGYNTNEQVKLMVEKASSLSEARWNYAFWIQNDLCVFGEEGSGFSSSASIDAMKSEFSKEIKEYNTGEKQNDWSACDDAAAEIANRTWNIAAEVAAELHQSNLIVEKFNRPIPIIVHETEYYQKIADINKIANPNGEADEFFVEWMHF